MGKFANHMGKSGKIAAATAAGAVVLGPLGMLIGGGVATYMINKKEKEEAKKAEETAETATN